MTTTQQGDLIEAIADAIDAYGFEAMAREFKAKPEHRERIVTAMVRNMRRDKRDDVATSFEALTGRSRRYWSGTHG